MPPTAWHEGVTAMFEGFATARIEANGVGLHVVHGGSGPAVLLLHGYPQTHVMWHKVAPDLARTCTVVPEEHPAEVLAALLDFYADIDDTG